MAQLCMVLYVNYTNIDIDGHNNIGSSIDPGGCDGLYIGTNNH